MVVIWTSVLLRHKWIEAWSHAAIHGRHIDWRCTMWTMNHASSDRGLLLKVSSLITCLGAMGHFLEVKEAAVCIRVGLGLHRIQSMFVLVAFSVHWACPHHHLLGLHLLLVLIHMLLLHLVHHKLVLTLLCNECLPCLLILIIDLVLLPLEWFDLKVFFFLAMRNR